MVNETCRNIGRFLHRSITENSQHPVGGGKFSKQFLCLSVVFGSGFSLVFEKTQVDVFTVHHYLSLPFLGSLAPRDALESRCVIFAFGSIGTILRVCRYAKVLFTVVETVTVFVVNLPRWVSRTQNFVHPDERSPAFTSDCPASIPIAVWCCPGMPFPLGKEFEILVIHEC